nr:hypothetical protein [Rhodoferax sp.]
MKQRSLPPQVERIQDGAVTWKRLESIDYELLGYFLSSHLIIEHYLDELLKILHAGLDWEASRLTCGQKIALLSKFKMPEQYNSIAAIKHLNSLRNKLSHRIDFKIEAKDLLPIKQFLEKIYQGKQVVSDNPLEVLEAFNGMVCVFFAGYISSLANLSRRGAP